MCENNGTDMCEGLIWLKGEAQPELGAALSCWRNMGVRCAAGEALGRWLDVCRFKRRFTSSVEGSSQLVRAELLCLSIER